MNRVLVALVAVVFGALAQSAFAASVTFDFTGGSYGFTSGSLAFVGDDNSTSVEVTAGNRGNSLTSHVSASSWGLLVCSGPAPVGPRSSASCGSGSSDYHYIDGGRRVATGDPDEYVDLVFSQQVRIQSASFYSSSEGDFDLFADGDKILNEERVGSNVLIDSDDWVTQLRFLADGNGDAFKLQSVTLEVSEVPLPAAAWLFLSAIGGLGLVGRRRRGAVATA